ncbi:MAG: substrate-binding domain-containing protein, partial [Paracoccaceae bacterium]
MACAVSRRSILAVVTAFVFAAPLQAQNAPPVIAAAADLKFAVTEIAQAFEADTGKTVEISLGSTGNFATQIRQGAP